MQGVLFANLLRIVIMCAGQIMMGQSEASKSMPQTTQVHPTRGRREGWVERLGIHLSRHRKMKQSETLSRRNIYIFPSKSGLGFLGMLLLMLVTAINYQNSLVYLFTFMLAAVFFVSIWLCFFELSGLEVSAGDPGDVAAGEAVPFNFRLQCGHDINLLYCNLPKGEEVAVHFAAGEHADVRLWSTPRNRGVYEAPRLKIATRFPFGLITAWTYVRIASTAYVYPKPEEAFSVQRQGQEGEHVQRRVDSDLPTDLRDYQQGDMINRVVWKHYASKDVMVVRTPEKYQPNADWLRWEDYSDVATEQRLRYLAYDVLTMSRTRRPFGLELPDAIRGPGEGAQFVQECLRALAGFVGSGRRP